MKILSVVGARPNFMKVAPIISAIKRHNSSVKDSKILINHKLVHTGQHYDGIMSDAFFSDLNLPKPDMYLGVGSGSHALQSAEIMKKFEEILLIEKPSIVIVVGDVNSTLACSLVASKISYDSCGNRPLIAHVEAGLRSFDRTMPEEINRIVTDHISDFLFVTEESGMKNLKNEGVPEEKIHFVGNTMIDTLLTFKDKSKESKILWDLRLIHKTNTIKPFVLITLHRPSNVDNKNSFSHIFGALERIAHQITVIFPVHPRTQSQIKNLEIESHYDINIKPLTNSSNRLHIDQVREKKINLIKPLGYLDFLSLMSNAKLVMTDSGGIQEETTCLCIPCVTIRKNTERPVTITQGTNTLVGTERDKIINGVLEALHCKNIKSNQPPLWDGKSAERILDKLLKYHV